jgi:hypothetical protein
MTKTKESTILTLSQLTEARSLWLKGLSLRTLAPQYGLTYSQLYNRLQKQFGADVCNSKANSLARSLYRDGLEWKDAPTGTEWFTGVKQDNVYTRSRMLDFSLAMAIIPYEPVEAQESMLLPWYILLTSSSLALIDKVVSSYMLQDGTNG